MLSVMSAGMSYGALLFTSLAAASALGISYLFIISIYRLYFHPLSKYPGPKLAAITSWYDVYHAWHGDRHLSLYLSHEQYGPIVRYAPNALSFNTSSALKTIYAANTNVKKSEFYSVFPAKKGAESTHSAIERHVHARKRRVLGQAFSENAVKGMERHILGNIRTFTETLGNSSTSDGMSVGFGGANEKKAWGQALNMSDLCNYLTFDIMGDLCFGKAFGMLDHNENRFAIELIGNAAHRHLICGTMPLLHTYHLDKLLFHKISAGRARYMDYSKSQSVQRTQMAKEDVDRKDFFTYLLSAKDPETGAGFSMQELWGESNLLIIAGSDTTSTALASTFFYLVHNPAALEKAAKEVRGLFADVEEIVKGTVLNDCHWLRACLDEAMRMSPPVGGILPREVQAGGLTVDGEELPRGTVVGVPIYSIHHNPNYFPEPFEYRPGRWLGNETSINADNTALARSAFCPFSIGSRGCIGKGLAYTELLTTLARTLFLYQLRLAPGSTLGQGSADGVLGRRRSCEYQLRDCFTSLKNGPLVEFQARED